MKEQGIEEIFKSALENFESDVDPGVWNNVQQAINNPMTGSGNTAHNGSIAGKAGALAGKLGVKTIVGIIAFTGATVITYLVLSSGQPAETTHPLVQLQQPVIVQTPVQQEPTVVAENSVYQSLAPHSEVPEKIPPPKQTADDYEQNDIVQADVAEGQSNAGANTAAANKDAGAGVAKLEQPAATLKGAPDKASTDNYQSTATPGDEDNSRVDQSYKNDFADVSDYLESEAATVKPPLPNIFSPNGDGKNDVFTIKTKNLKLLSVTVFDQSGKLIHQWTGIDGGWDGNLTDGRPAPAGSYFYSLLAETTDGKKCIAKSPLTLKR